MTYASSMLDKANSLNVNATASDLYLFAKAMFDNSITTVPMTFVKAVQARILNPGTTDPNELAYLLKILKFLGATALQGFFYDPKADLVRTIEQSVNTYPLQGIGDLIMPTNAIILATPGTYNFSSLYGHLIPAWYKDTTLLRVRVWGGGGKGADGGSHITTGGSGGGGGGYAEALLTWGQVKANPSIVVGAGAVSGNAQGSSVSGGLVTAGPGANGQKNTLPYDEEAGEYYSSVQASGGVGGAGGGTASLYVANGGSGGASYNTASMNFIAGSGGGGAAGPWGGGGIGGGSTSVVMQAGGHGGGGTGSTGQTAGGAVGGTGGTSTSYLSKWMTDFLRTGLGGVPIASTTVTASPLVSGPGCGGSGQYQSSTRAYRSCDGGAFGGGGGGSGGNVSVAGTYQFAGKGGIAAGGGGGGSGSQQGKGGEGGNGLVIVEFFA